MKTFLFRYKCWAFCLIYSQHFERKIFFFFNKVALRLKSENTMSYVVINMFDDDANSSRYDYRTIMVSLTLKQRLANCTKTFVPAPLWHCVWSKATVLNASNCKVCPFEYLLFMQLLVFSCLFLFLVKDNGAAVLAMLTRSTRWDFIYISHFKWRHKTSLCFVRLFPIFFLQCCCWSKTIFRMSKLRITNGVELFLDNVMYWLFYRGTFYTNFRLLFCWQSKKRIKG